MIAICIVTSIPEFDEGEVVEIIPHFPDQYYLVTGEDDSLVMYETQVKRSFVPQDEV